MRKVLIYSLLLVAGLIVSQLLGDAPAAVSIAIQLATMVALSFIMIHVGYEFEIDKANPSRYAWDYVVAGTAASFPWLLCAAYFIFVMAPAELWSHPDLWKESLLKSLFSAPTSAGVLFSMLAAAGLAATWVFQKARVLAIFDDLHTIILMIPLKIMMVGFRWQLAIVVVVIFILLLVAWKYLHVARLPVSWPYVLAYAVGITILSQGVYIASKQIDPAMPVHLEVLLPAFVLGCMLARPSGTDPHVNDATEGAEEGPESGSEQLASTIVSAGFMILVGLSIPPIRGEAPSIAPAAGAALTAPADVPQPEVPAPMASDSSHAAHPTGVLKYEGASPQALAGKDRFRGWGNIALHVLAVTVLSNLGKMFPALCYRREATLRERIALSFGMFPRGEVGGGVLVISLSYGLGGPALTVAVLSLALNLLCTGLFIIVVKKLLAGSSKPEAAVAV